MGLFDGSVDNDKKKECKRHNMGERKEVEVKEE